MVHKLLAAVIPCRTLTKVVNKQISRCQISKKTAAKDSKKQCQDAEKLKGVWHEKRCYKKNKLREDLAIIL